MRRVLTLLLACLLVMLLAAAAGFVYVVVTGLSARPAPGAAEARVARAVRALAVPRATRNARNPVAASPETIDRAMAHFAEHCAMCHGNDGSGSAEIGRGLFPRPPDMRVRATQDLTDGELFHIIENGVRFTGMPAFATGDSEGEEASWELVHFIRRLPSLSEADLARMAGMNPRSPEEIRQEIEDERFLQGEEPASPQVPHAPEHEGAHR